MTNAITIDVEDYFMVSAFAGEVKFEDWHAFECRVERNTKKILDMLDRLDIRATFFILGWVAENYPQLVKDICNRGHEIGSHGYAHRIIYHLSPREFAEDTKKSRKLLEDITGDAIKGYRAASYSITKKSMWALDILIEEGFTYDSSIFPIYHDRYGIPEACRFQHIIQRKGGSLLEIPPSTIRSLGKNIPVAGGGYLRLLPLNFVKRSIAAINNKEKQPAIIYFHPWEFDPEQPKVKSSLITHLRHHVNIDKTQAKVEKLLKTFNFGPVRDVFEVHRSQSAGPAIACP